MNELIIRMAQMGLSETIYYSFFGIGVITAYIFLIWYGKKIGLSTTKVVIAVALGSGLVLCVMEGIRIVLVPLENIIPIMNSYLNNMGRAFVFVPLIALMVSMILRTTWVKISNLYAFTQTIIWGIASLGCLFPGCCKGYPCKWGIYNAETGMTVFPTQVVNSILLLSTARYIFWRCKKRNYEPDGKEYPIMLILVGMIRFSTEFIMDNPKIVFGLSSLSFDALVMCVVGSCLFVIIHRRQNLPKD